MAVYTGDCASEPQVLFDPYSWAKIQVNELTNSRVEPLVQVYGYNVAEPGYSGDGWVSVENFAYMADGHVYLRWKRIQNPYIEFEKFKIVVVYESSDTAAGRFTSVELREDNSIHMNLETVPGTRYEVASSTNFATWRPLTNFLATNATAKVIDTRLYEPGVSVYRAQSR